MRWLLKEPKSGDIIRVKTGSIYHYGVYVSDSEVIQFGLPPCARQHLSDADIEVCSSDVTDFLVGGFLEVGENEKKDKKRFSPKKTVEKARSRLGEKGYHILYNNCEHFAYECYNGEKYSFQTESIRQLFRSIPVVDVYVAEIPQTEVIGKLIPRSRQKEIESVANFDKKREKYFVWKLLEYALKKSFSKEISKVKLKKNSSGKWVCSDCFFSLTHSERAVCVAVSNSSVGVDVEKIQKQIVDISKEILSEEEYEEYFAVADLDKPAFLADAWTKKESLFKLKDVKCVTREEFRLLNDKVFHKKITVNGDNYSLSVATAHPEKVKLYEDIDLTKV